jgi:hypothetical protein
MKCFVGNTTSLSACLIAFAGAGCSGGLDSADDSPVDDPGGYGSVTETLQGQALFDWTACPSATALQKFDIEVSLRSALTLNQVAGASRAYENCVRASMSGGIILPSAPLGQANYGPYDPATFRWQNPDGTFSNNFWHDPDFDYPDVRVARAVSNLKSPFAFKLFCNQTIAGSDTIEVPTAVNAKPEEIIFRFQPALNLAARVKAATTPAQLWLELRSHASLFMHDIAHDRSYAHTAANDPNDAFPCGPVCNAKSRIHALNNIADSCMHEVITEMSTACHATTCGSGQLPVPTAVNSSPTCTCGNNPRTNTMLATPLQIGGAGAEFAPDILGNVVALTPGRDAVWFRAASTGSWSQIGGPAGHVFIGAGKVFATSPDNSTVFTFQSGVWSNLGSAQFLTVDVRGDAYRVSGGTVQFLKTVSPVNWENIGKPPGGAANLIAGGGGATRNLKNGVMEGVGRKLYAIEASTGNVYRYSGLVWTRAGGPGIKFVVDSYGAIYGLASGQQIWKNVDGENWERIDTWTADTSSVVSIAAGDRLYVRRSKRATPTSPWTHNVIEQFAPDGTWKNVASGTDVVAAGKFVYTVDAGTSALMSFQ